MLSVLIMHCHYYQNDNVVYFHEFLKSEILFFNIFVQLISIRNAK